MGIRKDDLALAAATRRGERGAADALFERIFEPLYAHVARLVGGHRHEAEDIVADALLAGLRGLGGFRGDASLVTWFTRIALRKLVDRRRRRAATIVESGNGDLEALLATRASHGDATGDSPLDRLVNDELRSEVRDAVEALPEPHRTLLLWKYLEERSLAEVAEHLTLTPKAAERRLARARTALAAALRRRGLHV